MDIKDPNLYWKVIIGIGLISNLIGLVLLPDGFFQPDTTTIIDRSVTFAKLDFSYYISHSPDKASLDFLNDYFSLYYLISAPVYMLFPAVFPFTKIIPALLTGLLFFVSYKYFYRKLGGEWVIAFALFVNFSSFLRYSSINLIGQLSALLLLIALYYHETGNFRLKKIAILSTLFTRLTNLPLLLGELLQHRVKLVLLAIAIPLLISFYRDFTIGFPIGINFLNPLVFIATFFDFPPPSFVLFETFPYFPLSILFIILTFPVLMAIIADFRNIKIEHRYFLYMLFAVFLVSLTDTRMMGNMNWRHLSVVMPLLGLFFANGFYSLKPKKWIKLSLGLYAVYTLLMILFSSLYYQGLLNLN